MFDGMAWYPELFCFGLTVLLLLGMVHWTKRHPRH